LKTARKSGQGLVSSKDHLLDCTNTLVLWNLCTSGVPCTGTQFYQLCLDQSEIALKVGREQDSDP